MNDTENYVNMDKEDANKPRNQQRLENRAKDFKKDNRKNIRRRKREILDNPDEVNSILNPSIGIGIRESVNPD